MLLALLSHERLMSLAVVEMNSSRDNQLVRGGGVCKVNRSQTHLHSLSESPQCSR